MNLLSEPPPPPPLRSGFGLLLSGLALHVILFSSRGLAELASFVLFVLVDAVAFGLAAGRVSREIRADIFTGSGAMGGVGVGVVGRVAVLCCVPPLLYAPIADVSRSDGRAAVCAGRATRTGLGARGGVVVFGAVAFGFVAVGLRVTALPAGFRVTAFDLEPLPLFLLLLLLAMAPALSLFEVETPPAARLIVVPPPRRQDG